MKYCLIFCGLLFGCASQRGATEANLIDANNASPLGEVVYKERCARCHGQRGEGAESAPALMGEKTLASSEHGFKNGQQLFDFVTSQMPKNAPGSLSVRDYWAVVTYVLGGNGVKVPPGGLSEANAAEVLLDPD
jgi:cytochrome c